MNNSSPQNYVRIENSKFGNRGIICMSCIFLFSLLSCVIIGATGPDVIESRNDSVSTLEINSSGDAKWIGTVSDMMQLNQLFWLSVKVYRPQSTEDDIGVVETYINVTGYDSLVSGSNKKELFFNRHDQHEVYCSRNECSEFYIFGQSTIRFRRYDVHIQFHNLDSKFLQNDDLFNVLINLHTINSEYSKFELGWKSFFCLTTVLVLLLPYEGFAYKLYSIPFNLWSFEQVWVVGLLVCLFFFNDPFFGAQLYTAYADSFAVLYIVLTCTFTAVLLLFWLSVLDEMRVSASTQTLSSALSPIHSSNSHNGWIRRWYSFYGPKLALVSAIWSTLMSTFIYIRTERQGDPTYEGLDDWVLRNVEIVLVALLALYVLWLLVLLILNSSKIIQLSTPFRFLFVITICIYCIVLTGLFAGYFYPLSTSAVVFLCFYSVINFYIWTLAFAFAPLGTDEGYSKGVTSFGEDYFDEMGTLRDDMFYDYDL